MDRSTADRTVKRPGRLAGITERMPALDGAFARPQVFVGRKVWRRGSARTRVTWWLPAMDPKRAQPTTSYWAE